MVEHLNKHFDPKNDPERLQLQFKRKTFYDPEILLFIMDGKFQCITDFTGSIENKPICGAKTSLLNVFYALMYCTLFA